MKRTKETEARYIPDTYSWALASSPWRNPRQVVYHVCSWLLRQWHVPNLAIAPRPVIQWRPVSKNIRTMCTIIFWDMLKWLHFCETWHSHSSVADDAHLLRCDTMSLGKWLWYLKKKSWCLQNFGTTCPWHITTSLKTCIFHFYI